MHTIKPRKRFVAVSCSHGEIINPSARYELLTFCDQFKPHTTIHLGDFVDTTAFLKGGATTVDAPVGPDIDAGLQFLRDFHGYASGKRYTFCGNHEDRLWRLATDGRELVAYAAQSVIAHISTTCKLLDSPLYEYNRGQMWRLMGDTYFGHGTIFNMNACRDIAEQMGRSVVFGHTHKLTIQAARTNHRAIGYNIGWLGDVAKADYAKTRPATNQWRNGFAYGEYSDTDCRVNLYECRRGDANGSEERIG